MVPVLFERKRKNSRKNCAETSLHLQNFATSINSSVQKFFLLLRSFCYPKWRINVCCIWCVFNPNSLTDNLQVLSRKNSVFATAAKQQNAAEFCTGRSKPIPGEKRILNKTTEENKKFPLASRRHSVLFICIILDVFYAFTRGQRGESREWRRKAWIYYETVYLCSFLVLLNYNGLKCF